MGESESMPNFMGQDLFKLEQVGACELGMLDDYEAIVRLEEFVSLYICAGSWARRKIVAPDSQRRESPGTNNCTVSIVHLNPQHIVAIINSIRRLTEID